MNLNTIPIEERQVASAADAGPAAESCHDPVADCHEWHQHEHTTPVVQIHAEQLLDEAGSPELAKHAIDVAAQQAHVSFTEEQALMTDG